MALYEFVKNVGLMSDEQRQILLSIIPTFGDHLIEQKVIQSHKSNCRNCGANSFKENICEYCKTKN